MFKKKSQDSVKAEQKESGKKEIWVDGELIEIDNDESDVDMEQVSEKKRRYTGKMLMALNIICFGFAIFQLYVAGFGNITAHVLRAVHLGLGMGIVFLLYPITKKASLDKLPIYDLLLAIIATGVNFYIVFNYEALSLRAGMMTTMDMICGALLILLLLEAARRVVGPILTGIASFFILYCYFGPYFPGAFGHRGVSIEGIVRHMVYTTEGIFGTALGVSASFIFLFILMGAILTHMGTGEFLIQIALALFGKQRGGPAKAAVFASALFGTINGSTIANLATVGTFTIPLMKRVGFKPYFAGSIESTASLGGQIMPPVMGAAAFIIAEFVGVSYLEVCLAAAIPAVLYFTSVLFAVHQEAVRLHIKGLPPEEIPKVKEVLKKSGYLILPIVVIVGALAFGYSPAMAGFLAIISAILLSYIRPESRLTPKKLFHAFADGARSALEVLIACAVVGFIVGSFTITGLGLKLAGIVVDVGGGMLLPTLLMTAVASLILGMGVPTTANYVMMAMITVPAVAAMGVPVMAAHMFCFYFGIISDITPPVALGALAGAGIAGAKFLPTAVNATKLAIAAYVAPFFFVYNPILLLGVEPFSWEIFIAFPTAVIGIMLLSCAIYKFTILDLKWYERVFCAVLAFGCILPNTMISIVTCAVYLVFYKWQRNKRMRFKGTIAKQEITLEDMPEKDRVKALKMMEQV